MREGLKKEFHDAIILGKTRELRSLLKEIAQFNEERLEGKHDLITPQFLINNHTTPLIQAILGEQYEIARILCEENNGLDPLLDFRAPGTKINPLHIAIYNSSNKEFVSLLLKNGVKFEREAHELAWRGHEIELKKLEDNEIKEIDQGGLSVLHYAAAGGQLSIMKFLINEKKLEVDIQDNCGNTPLFYAINGGNFPITKWLVEEKNASLDRKDKGNSTVLHNAAFYGQLEITKWLLEKKPDLLFDKNSEHLTALDFAIMNEKNNKNHLDIVLYFLEREPDLISRAFFKSVVFDKGEQIKILLPKMDKQEAATIAIFSGKLPLIQSLINDYNIQLEDISFGNHGALHLSTLSIYNNMAFSSPLKRRRETTKWLIEEKGMDINQRGPTGRTILHHAVELQDMELMKYLLLKGIDFTAKDDDNQTALDLAMELYDIHLTGTRGEVVATLLISGVGIKAKISEVVCNYLGQRQHPFKPVLIAAKLEERVINSITNNLELRQAIINGEVPNNKILEVIVAGHLAQDPDNEELQQTLRLVANRNSLKWRCEFFIAQHKDKYREVELQSLPTDLYKEILIQEEGLKTRV